MWAWVVRERHLIGQWFFTLCVAGTLAWGVWLMFQPTHLVCTP